LHIFDFLGTCVSSPKSPLSNFYVMSSPTSRLNKILNHFLPSSASPTAADLSKTEYAPKLNFHTLSPTYFLPRAAAIEPEVQLYPGIATRFPTTTANEAIGSSDIPRHRKWQRVETQLWRVCRPSAWVWVLFGEAWIQACGHPWTEYAWISGSIVWNWSCR